MGAAYNRNDPASREAYNKKARETYRLKHGIPLDASCQRGRKIGSTNKKVEDAFNKAITAMGPLKYYWQ